MGLVHVYLHLPLILSHPSIDHVRQRLEVVPSTYSQRCGSRGVVLVEDFNGLKRLKKGGYPFFCLSILCSQSLVYLVQFYIILLSCGS